MKQPQFIVVGGTSGIGLEIVKQFLNQNFIVHTISRSRHASTLTHSNLTSHHCDVTADASELPEINGEVAGLCYCPGSINLKPFRSLRMDDYANDFNINFLSMVKVVQKYLPNLAMGQSASILLFSTVAVQTGMAFHTSIAAAKGAVEGFARSLAAELAPKIRVNVIAPSLTPTALSEKLINNETRLKTATERHPLKRIGDASEIASMATFLSSDKAAWITGQIIKIDGGLSAIS